jgi:hypothetical protein
MMIFGLWHSVAFSLGYAFLGFSIQGDKKSMQDILNIALFNPVESSEVCAENLYAQFMRAAVLVGLVAPEVVLLRTTCARALQQSVKQLSSTG